MLQYLTLKEASRLSGISVDNLRHRVYRHEVETTKDERGRILIAVDTEESQAVDVATKAKHITPEEQETIIHRFLTTTDYAFHKAAMLAKLPVQFQEVQVLIQLVSLDELLETQGDSLEVNSIWRE